MSWKRNLRRLASLGGLCVGVGCIAAGDDRCSPGEDFDHGLCYCEPPRVLDEGGRCIEATAPEAGMGVEPPTEGFGVSCSRDTDCSSDYHALCATAPNGDRFCTHADCDGNSDCPNDSYCAGEKPHCKRFPTGLGTACGSDADCSGFDADLCTVGAPGGATCVLADCSADPDCPPTTVCNDFTSFVPDAPLFCSEPLL